MSATNRNQEKDQSERLAESDDDFQYDEVSLGDDWSVTEGEEDLEATVKAIKDRADVTAAARRPNSNQPEAVDVFLRNFLSQMDMKETLECFQAEWEEMVAKELVDTGLVGVVPEVFTENQRLDRDLRDAQREHDEYRLAAAAGAEALARAKKDRDLRRMQHRRVVQEKNKLIEEVIKLKEQCKSYEPAVKRINEKYQARQTMLEALERRRAEAPNPQLCGEEAAVNVTGKPSVKASTHPVMQPRPPTSAKTPTSQTRVKTVKAHVK